MAPPVEWHPRRLADPVEWLLRIPGQPDPVGVVRKLTDRRGTRFRAVTWSAQPTDRTLIGYYPDGDTAATAVWRLRGLASRLARGRIQDPRQPRTPLTPAPPFRSRAAWARACTSSA